MMKDQVVERTTTAVAAGHYQIRYGFRILKRLFDWFVQLRHCLVAGTDIL